MLNSGDSCTIKELFASQFILQIPDMQRDYCWAKTIADVNGKSLIENFISDLISQLESEDAIQMGLLYAYESPKNHIQLCDGQQRLTTIYLTLCILYKHLKTANIKNIIVQDDDNQLVPRLQYAIRETTLSFLSDFVQEVIISDNTDIHKIKKADWYFLEYDNDPSIQNILLAIEIIENKISKLDTKGKLADFLLSKISFLYFDMVNRTYGEEQFVVLNTTGKPLTKTENIKPKLLGELDDKVREENLHGKTQLRYYADLWEEWESYFWKNKHDEHQTADKGLNEFFRWVYVIERTNTEGAISSQVEKYNDSQKALSTFRYNIFEIADNNSDILDVIHSYFQILKVLEQDKQIRQNLLFTKQQLSQIQCFELLPLLNFIKKYKISNYDDKDYKRLKFFLHNRAKDENVSKASITTAIEAIRISKLMEIDLVAYEHYDRYISSTLFNACERFKFNIYKYNANRNEIEDSFWKAEKLKTSHGNIAYIFEALQININETIFSINLLKFDKVVQLIMHIFEQPSDLLRSALLTYGDYCVWHGHTSSLQANRYTLGTDAKFYGGLANSADSNIKKTILDFLKSCVSDIEQNTPEAIQNWMQKQIDDFETCGDSIKDKTRYSLIKQDALHKFMENKLFCISYDNTKSYAIKKQNVRGKGAYKAIIKLTD